MEYIKAWRRGGERLARHKLSQDAWDNAVLELGSEGYSVKRIEHIMTGGLEADQPIRNLWNLGPGNGNKWDDPAKKRATYLIYDLFRTDIEKLYHGSDSTKGMSPAAISAFIKSTAGFNLPPSSLLNEMKTWGIQMRQQKAHPSLPATRKLPPRSPEGNPQPVPAVVLKALEENYARLSGMAHRHASDFKYELADIHAQLEVEKEARQADMSNIMQEITKIKAENSLLKTQVVQLQEEKRLLAITINDLITKNQCLAADHLSLKSAYVTIRRNFTMMKTDNLAIQRKFSELQLENSNLRIQKSELADTVTLLMNVIGQIVSKLDDLNSNLPADGLKDEVKRVSTSLKYLKFNSQRVSIDSGYHDDPDARQSLNLIPIGLQTTPSTQAPIGPAISTGQLASDSKRRRYEKFGTDDMMQSLSEGFENGQLAERTSAPAGLGSQIDLGSFISAQFKGDEQRMSYIHDPETRVDTPSFPPRTASFSVDASTATTWDESMGTRYDAPHFRSARDVADEAIVNDEIPGRI